MRRSGLAYSPLMLAVALAACSNDDAVSAFESGAGTDTTTTTTTGATEESGSGDAGEGSTDDGAPDLPPPDPYCGDLNCNADENCLTCATDCGACVPCDLAPVCEGGLIPPVIDVHYDALDIDERDNPRLPADPSLGLAHDPGAGASARPGAGGSSTVGAPIHTEGAENCGPAQLRLRVANLTVHDKSELTERDSIYCVITVEGDSGAELRILPPTAGLDNGDDFNYALSEGVIWGQEDKFVETPGNLLITYNCIESDSTGDWEDFLDAIADGANGIGGVPGGFGWILPTIGGVAGIIGAALSFESDDHLMNASQIISAEQLYDLSNGVWWSVRKQGEASLLNDFDWELRIEAWGCADTVPPPAG